jgi:hypothetical protein
VRSSEIEALPVGTKLYATRIETRRSAAVEARIDECEVRPGRHDPECRRALYWISWKGLRAWKGVRDGDVHRSREAAEKPLRAKVRRLYRNIAHVFEKLCAGASLLIEETDRVAGYVSSETYRPSRPMDDYRRAVAAYSAWLDRPTDETLTPAWCAECDRQMAHLAAWYDGL